MILAYSLFAPNYTHYINNPIGQLVGPIKKKNGKRRRRNRKFEKINSNCLHGNGNEAAPSCLDSSVGRALHRYRRGHGFESRSSLNFFQAFFSQLLKLRSNCEELFSIWSFIRSSKIYVSYIYIYLIDRLITHFVSMTLLKVTVFVF